MEQVSVAPLIPPVFLRENNIRSGHPRRTCLAVQR